MKYLKYLQTSNDFESFKNSEDYVLPNVSYIEETKGVSYEPLIIDMRDNYLTIQALEDGLTVSLSRNACEYCVDGDGNWKTLAADTATESINNGQTLSFRGELTPAKWYGIGAFTINKKCNLKGNCMSMLFGDNATNNFSLSGKIYAFYNLFYNCNSIISISKTFLPATTLSESCYESMFQNCTDLVNTTELPATTLDFACYRDMFNGCTSLTTAPELPATTLSDACYGSMFEGCTSLTTAPELPVTTLTNSCYHSMFKGCTSLTTAPELPATTLSNACYACYGSMFEGCTKLNYIKMLATNVSESGCLNYWVKDVASRGTFVKQPDMIYLSRATDYNNYAGIPMGWIIEDVA